MKKLRTIETSVQRHGDDAKCIWLADPVITKTKVQIGSGLQRLDISL